MSREAMKLALEALELLAKWENPLTTWQVRKPKDGGPIVTIYPHKVATDAATLLRERLAQPEQEPVAWRWKERVNGDFDNWVVTFSEPPPYAVEQQPLYTAPPKQWVGLTDEEVQMFIDARWSDGVNFTHFIRAIEAKLKEKNHG